MSSHPRRVWLVKAVFCTEQWAGALLQGGPDGAVEGVVPGLTARSARSRHVSPAHCCGPRPMSLQGCTGRSPRPRAQLPAEKRVLGRPSIPTSGLPCRKGGAGDESGCRQFSVPPGTLSAALGYALAGAHAPCKSRAMRPSVSTPHRRGAPAIVGRAEGLRRWSDGGGSSPLWAARRTASAAHRGQFLATVPVCQWSFCDSCITPVHCMRVGFAV